MTPEILKLNENQSIAYHRSEGDKSKPTVIFLGGLMSDMQGTKALALEKFCKEKKYGFVRFDYIGHGQSSGEFTDGTITIWKNNALAVMDNLTEGELVLVGSSLGGWLMILAALERKGRVVGLVGVASAPDFTEELIWEKMSLQEKSELKEKGIFMLKSDYGDEPYPITKGLIEDGRKNIILDKKINLDCPVRLLHGMEDEDVPNYLSIALGQQLTTDNMCVNLIAGGDHRLSTDENISLICDTLGEMIDNMGKVWDD
ncbi:MAG: alpha/beta hydrolase [Rickettsiales bacterium]|nr:alpha/beta hydrolase [Pseudomonadota bacterium]MDA0966346.1 alpha/beta hydrolase [Pseudomonadota bacterium]MDG4543978.1 alpha/beta hydrolase [Rickettsiales bacterium]MDG4545472.1 alpha/beta hydrolase [Rickettsiales bacterium]MDG4547921.1 alpha/beta hydrolase [Rickettsiales bacterium]